MKASMSYSRVGLVAFFVASTSWTLSGARSDAAEATPTATASDATDLGEIVVTAQKRSQSINDVGMAVSALSSDALERAGVVDTADLAKVVPAFSFAESQKGTPVYTIRGVGYYEESLSASPAVSVYSDEVAYPFPEMTKAATLDLARVEVLKGPQGTLYGQNSTGGAINYIAASPTPDFEGGIDASYGRFNAATVDGFVSGPLSDTVRARLAASTDQGGAWQQSYTRGDMLGNADIKKGRLILEWTPNEDLKVTVNLNGWTDNSDSLASALYKVTPEDPGLALPIAFRQVIAPETPGTADWTTGKPLKLDESYYQGSVRVDYRFSEQLKFASLTSYEHYDQNDYHDISGSSLEMYNVQQLGSIQSYSQELRSFGRIFADRVDWLVGVDYAHDLTHELNTAYIPYSSPAQAFTPFGLPAFTGVTQLANNAISTKALFSNWEYRLSEQWSLHAGGRLTESDTKFNGCSQSIDPGLALGFTALEELAHNSPEPPLPIGACVTFNADAVPGLITSSLDQKNASWRVGVDWKPVPGSLVYATVSKGYKSGSFPSLSASSYIQLQPVTEESVLAYELGFKSNLGSRSVQLNGAVFYYDYTDKQFRARVLDPLGVFGALEALVNVPKSVLDGSELSLMWRPVAGLTLNGSATYLYSDVTKDFFNYDPFGTPVNFKGDAFPFTPKWSFQFSPFYEWDVNDRVSAFAGATLTYQSRTTSAFGGSPLVSISAYPLLDLQAGAETSDGHWRVTLWGKNVANQYYWTDTFRETDNLSRHVGKPATFGLKVAYRF